MNSGHSLVKAFWFSTRGVALPVIFCRVRKEKHTLDIPRHPNTSWGLVFGWYIFWVQRPSQQVFGCLGKGKNRNKDTMKQNQDIRLEEKFQNRSNYSEGSQTRECKMSWGTRGDSSHSKVFQVHVWWSGCSFLLSKKKSKIHAAFRGSVSNLSRNAFSLYVFFAKKPTKTP